MRSAPYAPASMVVRPEIADSVIRLLDKEAESFGHGSEPGEQALSATFAGFAKRVRAGKQIFSTELDFQPLGAPLRREITSAIEHTVWMNVSEDGDRVESSDMWRYVSDLAALAADIEASSSA